jgi:hypothetical protein
MATLKKYLERRKDIILAVIDASLSNYNRISHREHYVLTKILFEEKTLKECGDLIDLTPERVRQIFQKGMQKLLLAIAEMPDSFTTNQDLLTENLLLKGENAELRKEVGVITNFTSAPNSFFFQQKIRNIGLPTRVCVRLKMSEVDTVGDLMKISKSELLKYRNFGKKSLSEIEEFLAKRGLTLKE